MMILARGLAVSMLFAVPQGALATEPSNVLLAWQMETVQPSEGPGVAGSGPNGRGFGGGVGSQSGSGVDFGIEPIRPGGRGPLFESETRRPSVFGEGREPLFRPGSGRNCTGEGPGRVCF